MIRRRITIFVGKLHRPPAQMADVILDAIIDFSVQAKPSCLKLVRIVVKQAQMMDEIHKVILKKKHENKITSDQ